MLGDIAKTIWLLLPAYTPNNFAVLFGGGMPIDMGKRFIDGRRILGDGKTVRGFLAGVIGGVFVAHLQLMVERVAGFEMYSSLPYTDFFTLTLMLALGSMVGDSVGSFIKRRFGVERGRCFPILDQLTFLIFSYLFAMRVQAFWRVFTTEVIAIGLLITPLLHLTVNALAYMLKLKEVPW